MGNSPVLIAFIAPVFINQPMRSNIYNIDNIDNTDNIDNIDNTDNIDNIDNTDNIDNIDHIDLVVSEILYNYGIAYNKIEKKTPKNCTRY